MSPRRLQSMSLSDSVGEWYDAAREIMSAMDATSAGSPLASERSPAVPYVPDGEKTGHPGPVVAPSALWCLSATRHMPPRSDTQTSLWTAQA
jgi:hypothetical protein